MPLDDEKKKRLRQELVAKKVSNDNDSTTRFIEAISKESASYEQALALCLFKLRKQKYHKKTKALKKVQQTFKVSTIETRRRTNAVKEKVFGANGENLTGLANEEASKLRDDQKMDIAFALHQSLSSASANQVEYAQNLQDWTSHIEASDFRLTMTPIRSAQVLAVYANPNCDQNPYEIKLTLDDAAKAHHPTAPIRPGKMTTYYGSEAEWAEDLADALNQVFQSNVGQPPDRFGGMGAQGKVIVSSTRSGKVSFGGGPKVTSPDWKVISVQGTYHVVPDLPSPILSPGVTLEDYKRSVGDRKITVTHYTPETGLVP